METLVLNPYYQPIQRISWQEAFRLIFTGRAEVVENYADRVVHSACAVFPMPSIVRFVRMARKVFRRGVKFNRRNVYLRDKGRCQYCGERIPSSEFEFEHVIPKARGGKTCWQNIVVACTECNRKKGNRTPEEARMRLLCKPIQPKSVSWANSAHLSWSEGMPGSWKDYLRSVRYWHDELDGSRS